MISNSRYGAICSVVAVLYLAATAGAQDATPEDASPLVCAYLGDGEDRAQAAAAEALGLETD